jgi:PAS domain S-box-containing protein
MFVPIYRHGMSTATVEERRAALQGWVYSPYRMSDLMRGILGGWDSPTTRRIRLQVFDGKELSSEGLLYDTQAADKPFRRPASGLTLQAPITFAGRDWTLLFTQGSTPASVAAYGAVWGVASGGTVLSLLLAGLLHSLRNTRFNARRLAGQLTADLQNTTDRLALATAAGGVGIWDYDVVNNHLVWDDQMFRLYGITRTQFSGAYEAWTAGVHPDDRQRGDEEIQQALRGEKEFDTEFRVLWPDGSICHLQAQARVQRNAAGQPVRMLGTNWDITAQKQAAAALQESEANFRTFFESMTDLIFVGTPTGRILFTNSAVTRTLGYSAAELTTMQVLDVHPADKREEAEDIFGAMFRGKRDSCPLPLAHKDGSLVPVETRVWFGKWNGAHCLFGISKNLTAELEAQQRFERLFRGNPALMALSTLPERQFFDVNDAFLNATGYVKGEVIGHTAGELSLFPHPEQQAALADKLQAAGHITDFELQVRRADGKLLYGLFSGEVIQSQGQAYFLTVMIDITARKQAETALRESEENVLLLLNSTAEAIYGIDLNGDCTFCNNSCLRLLGYQQPAELLGKNMHWQIHGQHADGSCFALEDCRIFQAFRTGEPTHVDDEVLWRADGSAFPAEYWSYPQRRNGVVIGAVVTFLDITVRQQAEAELLRTLAAERELSALKTMVVNTVSHEFRTPLATILGAAELLDDYYDRLTPEKRTGYFQLIRQEIQRLAAMVQDVLVQGQLDAGRVQFQPRPADVPALCRETVARVQLAFPKYPPVHWEADAPGPPTLVDASLLDRVLSNLLTNAIKYSPALTPVRVTVRRVAEEWEIQVQDQGLGIPEADRADLFSAFRRGSNVGNIKGTGVGLYIVKQCAELHGGRVELRPQAGPGSTFVFAFPWRLADTATETP